MITVTEGILDALQVHTAHRLAGLEVPDGTIYKYNAQTGESEIFREAPELPSGRALLAQLLREGRPVRDRFVQIAKEAAVVELLLAQPTKGKGKGAK